LVLVAFVHQDGMLVREEGQARICQVFLELYLEFELSLFVVQIIAIRRSISDCSVRTACRERARLT
jgi:hypothetical protein